MIGAGGAGKTTVALELGRILALPVVHLDTLYWLPGWIPRTPGEWEALQRAALAGDSWIADGNFPGTMDFRLGRADTIVFLDLPRLLCLWRALYRRRRLRGQARPDLPPGCVEGRIDRGFVAFLSEVWRFPHEGRPRLLGLLARYEEGRDVVVLRSRAEVTRFLDRVRGASSSSPSSG